MRSCHRDCDLRKKKQTTRPTESTRTFVTTVSLINVENGNRVSKTTACLTVCRVFYEYTGGAYGDIDARAGDAMALSGSCDCGLDRFSKEAYGTIFPFRVCVSVSYLRIRGNSAAFCTFQSRHCRPHCEHTQMLDRRSSSGTQDGLPHVPQDDSGSYGSWHGHTNK